MGRPPSARVKGYSVSSFANRLVDSVVESDCHCVVGLDPRIELMPEFITAMARSQQSEHKAIRDCVYTFNRCVISAIVGIVPAVKLQVAFYEQYGIAGMEAFQDTITEARRLGLIVMVDAKRNDISSSAEAYANAFLGKAGLPGRPKPIYDVDCVTVNPYMGVDSMEPFVDACRKYEKGIFVLVKTSNSGSADLQNLQVIRQNGTVPLYWAVAEIVNGIGGASIGRHGYSDVGAVVGATCPDEARQVRQLMPHTYFLVPGYGAQGGNRETIAPCFNADGLGAIVNASRSITYDLPNSSIEEKAYVDLVRRRAELMRDDVNQARLLAKG